MSQADAPPPVSRLDLERLVLGRLGPEEQARLEARLAEDAEARARLDRVRSEIDAARRDLPPLQLPWEEAAAAPPSLVPEQPPALRLVPPPAAPASSKTPSWAWSSLGLAAAAAALAFVVVPGAGPTAPAPTAVETFRGSFDLEVHRLRAGEARPVGALVEARAGDKLQYSITPAADGHWMVVDVQDDGEVSLWTPSRPVQAGVPATAAVQLDDYAGSERAYFLLTDSPLAIEDVRAAHAAAFRKTLAELDQLPGLPGAQRSLLIVKVP